MNKSSKIKNLIEDLIKSKTELAIFMNKTTDDRQLERLYTRKLEDRLAAANKRADLNNELFETVNENAIRLAARVKELEAEKKDV